MVQFHIENLTFSYPCCEKKVLDHISFTIQQGEYIALCGKSGSGKSTLLRHFKSVLMPYGKRSGRIVFQGVPLEDVNSLDQSAKIGFVMQNPDDQIVTDKVWHELAYGLECIGTDPETMRLRVAEMACYFGIQDWFQRDVSTLSGGQKQLLNLASIMAMQPDVLILDEPTSQLDPIAASDFLNTLRKINVELGTTVIITEHRLEDIYPAADRVIVLEDGHIAADDTPRNAAHYLWQCRSSMFAALPTPVRVYYESGGAGKCPLTVREGRNWLTQAFFGRTIAFEAPEQKAFPEKSIVALKMKDVWLRYGRELPDVLRGTSVSVPEGCIFAIVGGNGAGKSTALRAICGTNKIYQGSIEVLGKPLKKYKAGELFHHGLAMLPQDPKSLFVRHSVREELEEMLTDPTKIQEIASLCQIENLMDAHPFDLPGGEQQRVALGKVLLTQPRLLLLDEPTKGLDAFFKIRFAEILQQLVQKGVTVVMVSHDVEFCAEYADYVSMFFDGQILTTQRPQEFFGQNSFYTTAANRMSRCVFRNAVNASDVVTLYKRNQGAGR